MLMEVSAAFFVLMMILFVPLMSKWVISLIWVSYCRQKNGYPDFKHNERHRFSLVGMFAAKCGSIEDAWKMFHKM
jgi:hypothetical protein